ncbi:efflux RND transporter periplasmic adaptor subunit [Microbulbifer sp. OS29]|uniref:Efflux RND transporter periplasmic adaptor subunit n=1 Tax=Microbulbifer okhotskensis TaxID=2926617 RepID=A0A9X2EUH2_9GAMM|nr:efflux RND transporter periplasmic adaptor subunit [Microbulbifer okhotskensis]MCO1336098.1 efflux RND transporter periplasmic adaptor subunit [Microbulbifer okhotskensis]
MARILLISVALVALCACGGKDKQEKAPPPPPVEILVVREEPVIPRYEFVGRVEATDEYQVRPRVQGYIESRNFKEGDTVEKGQLLFEIDPRPFIAELDNQRATLEQSQASLRVAERNFRRGRRLVATGAISQVQMDELKGTFEETGSQVDANRAKVQSAELDLSYTKIYAPLTGRIGRTGFTVGSLVGPNSDPLTTIVKMDPIYVLFEVPEEQLFAVQMDTQRRQREGLNPTRLDVRIELPDGNYYPSQGKIVFIDNQIDPNTGSVAVRALFSNPDKLLVQGQFARVSIRVFAGNEALRPLVPQSAVMEDMQGRYVFVLGKKNIAEKRYLTLGQREGELWAVTRGIAAGESVIVNGLQRVVADKPVTPQNTPRNPYDVEASPVPPAERADTPSAPQNNAETPVEGKLPVDSGEMSPEKPDYPGAEDDYK